MSKKYQLEYELEDFIRKAGDFFFAKIKKDERVFYFLMRGMWIFVIGVFFWKIVWG